MKLYKTNDKIKKKYIFKQPTDKFIKGLGVILAKTPSMLLLKTKTGNHQKQVLYENFFSCLLFVELTSSQVICNVCFHVTFCLCALIKLYGKDNRFTIICDNNNNKNELRLNGDKIDGGYKRKEIHLNMVVFVILHCFR